MASVKSTMGALGIAPGGSLLFRFFGFIRARVPPDPVTTTASVSMLGQIRSVQQQHIHLNVIRVGFDAIPGGAAAQDQALQSIDYATFRTRIIYAAVNLGVGRVLHWHIDAADADGADDIGSKSESDDLVASWSVPNNGIDAFVVRNISASFVGKASAIPGECDKTAPDDGVVAGEASRTGDGFARTFAHETGHHLGLSHNHGAKPDCPNTTTGCNNLMAQTRCATSCGGGTRVAVLLTSAQGSTMRGHCSVQNGI
jgi:hypothetical protein